MKRHSGEKSNETTQWRKDKRKETVEKSQKKRRSGEKSNKTTQWRKVK